MNTKEKIYGKNVKAYVYFIKQLDNLGIEKKYIGYYLLVEIMQIMINEDRCITSFSKQLYPRIAEKFNKTECTVERNIRNLINKCWNYNLMAKLEIYFQPEKKPTCRQFIYIVKDYMAKQLM